MKTNDIQSDTKSKIGFYDLLFFICSIVFNIAISGLYLAVKFDLQLLLKICGLIVVFLTIPFTVTLMGFKKSKSPTRKIIMNMIVLFYLVLELFLDYIFKIPFRDILSIHIPYIIVFYAAASSMILVVWKTGRIKGSIVLLTFILLIICLIYMFSN